MNYQLCPKQSSTFMKRLCQEKSANICWVHINKFIDIKKGNVKIFKGLKGGETKVGSFGVAGKSLPAGAFGTAGASVPDAFFGVGQSVQIGVSVCSGNIFWS